jgi:hypothetical protein
MGVHPEPEMGVRLSGEGVEGELLLLARDGVEGVVGGLLVFGCGGPLVGEFVSPPAIAVL